MDNIASIIEAITKTIDVVETPIKVVALVIIVLAAIALRFFGNDSPAVRLSVFVVLIVSSGLLIYVLFSSAQSPAINCKKPHNLTGEEIQRCLDEKKLSLWQQ